MQRRYLPTYSYDIVLLYSLGCIHPIPTYQTLITLITLIIESFLSSEQITLTLSVQPRCLLTYSYDIVMLYSLGCIHPIPTCQTLIILITLVTESFLIICTENVNAICATTISSNLQLWYCIAVFAREYPPTTYMPNTDWTYYTGYRVVFIIWTNNYNGPLFALNWILPLRVSDGYFLTVRAQLDWIKGGQDARQEHHQEGYFNDHCLKKAIVYPLTLS